jgi:hypothetical protein
MSESGVLPFHGVYLLPRFKPPAASDARRQRILPRDLVPAR